MIKETTLSKALTVAGAKAQLDEKAKEILSDKGLLSHIMKECVDELKDFDICLACYLMLHGML